MAGGLVLKKGQFWEKFRSTSLGDGELTGRYELTELFEHFYGNFAFLRNLETGGVAKVSQRWLYEGESRALHGCWRLSN